MDPEGLLFLYSTYLGGVRDDEGRGVALDARGHAYVVGRTDSADFPTTTDSLDGRKSNVDGFLAKLGIGGDHALFSTFIGGSAEDEAFAVAVDVEERAWVVGWTQSEDFPVTPDAVQPRYRGRRDGFALRLSPSGAHATYATLVGGSAEDEACSVGGGHVRDAVDRGDDPLQDLDVSADAAFAERGVWAGRVPRRDPPEHGNALLRNVPGGPWQRAPSPSRSRTGPRTSCSSGRRTAPRRASKGRFSGSRGGPLDALVARFGARAVRARAESTELGVGVGVQLESTEPRVGKPFRLRVHSAPPNTQGHV